MERSKIKERGTYFILKEVAVYAKYFRYLPKIGGYTTRMSNIPTLSEIALRRQKLINNTLSIYM